MHQRAHAGHCVRTLLVLLTNLVGATAAFAQIQFAPEAVHSGVSCPTAVVAADFDQDGQPDFAFTNLDPSGSDVAVFAGQGGGLSTQPIFLNTPSPPGSLAVGDFNEDGDPDLFVASVFGSTTTLHLGGPGLTFAPAAPGVVCSATGLDCVHTTTEVSVVDWDQDGHDDVVLTSMLTNFIVIGCGDGTGAFPVLVVVQVGGGSLSAVVADFNNDGRLDVAAARISGGFSVALASPVPLLFQAPTFFPNGGIVAETLLAADLNGDGSVDLFGSAETPAGAWARFGDGAGAFLATQIYTQGVAPGFKAESADFDGDGHLDLAVCGHNPNQGAVGASEIKIWRGSGTGAFLQPQLLTAHSPWALAAVDIDGNGARDLIAANGPSDSYSRYVNLAVPAAAQFVRADINGDNVVNIADAVATLAALFVPLTPTPSCLDASDSNDDGSLDIADAVYTLTALFVGGASPPPAPFPLCGVDPSADGLNCISSPACP